MRLLTFYLRVKFSVTSILLELMCLVSFIALASLFWPFRWPSHHDWSRKDGGKWGGVMAKGQNLPSHFWIQCKALNVPIPISEMSNRLILPPDVVKHDEALQKWVHFAQPVPPTIHDWGKNGGRITGGDGKKRPAFGWPLFHFFSGRAAFSRVLCKNHLIWTWQNFSGTKPVLGSPQPVLFSFCQGCKGWVLGSDVPRPLVPLLFLWLRRNFRESFSATLYLDENFEHAAKV